MSFDWNDYHDLAVDLTNAQLPFTASEEARLRSSVSRAYYCAHALSKQYVGKKVKLGKGPQVHGIVISHLETDSDPLIAQAGLDLKTMRKARNKADYDENFSGWNIQASEALRRGYDIRNALP